jgi:CcmD family protein
MSSTGGRLRLGVRRTTPIFALAVAIALAVAVWGQPGVQASQDNPPVHTDAVAPQSDPQPDDDPDPNLGFLFGVFIVTWAGFFGYAFVISRRQRELQREIAALRAILEERRDLE